MRARRRRSTNAVVTASVTDLCPNLSAVKTDNVGGRRGHRAALDVDDLRREQR